MDRPLLCVLKKKGNSFFLFQSFQTRSIFFSELLQLRRAAQVQRPRDRSSHGTAFRKPNAFTAAVLSVTTKKKKKKKNWGNGGGVLHDGKQQLVQVFEVQEAEEEGLTEARWPHGSWLSLTSKTLEWNKSRVAGGWTSRAARHWNGIKSGVAGG
ncbi:unnamed protein product [Sphagnum balticum]